MLNALAASPATRTDQRVAPLRVLLREATQEVHERLHRHEGFAAVQNSTIDIAAYRRLLRRLYGFYVPFETAAAVDPIRSGWLREDLRTLEIDRPTLRATLLCDEIPGLASAERRLGALYVVEGSALGGRGLARGLDGLLGRDVTDGRRFFTGRGAGTGEAWRRYLAQLSAASDAASARTRVVSAALETFEVFETWLSGWSSPSHG